MALTKEISFTFTHAIEFLDYRDPCLGSAPLPTGVGGGGTESNAAAD